MAADLGQFFTYLTIFIIFHNNYIGMCECSPTGPRQNHQRPPRSSVPRDYELQGDILIPKASNNSSSLSSYDYYQSQKYRSSGQSVDNFFDGYDVKGDILIPRFKGQSSGTLFSERRWPNATIPYEISTEFGSNERQMILEAMNEISSSTCIRFTPLLNDGTFVYIKRSQNSRTCNSVVGRNPRVPVQHINLGADCFVLSTVLHELVHAIGFNHEHTRTDRDKFITIIEENILGNKDDYAIDPYVDDFGVDYDYQSVMHYSAFPEVYGRRVIESKPPGKIFGTAKHLSEKDKLKINRMYKGSCQEKLAETEGQQRPEEAVVEEDNIDYDIAESYSSSPLPLPYSRSTTPTFPLIQRTTQPWPPQQQHPRPPSTFCQFGALEGPKINTFTKGCCFTNTTYHYDCTLNGRIVSYWDEWRSITTGYQSNTN